MKKVLLLISACILLLSTVNSNSARNTASVAILPFKLTRVPVSYQTALFKSMNSFLYQKSPVSTASTSRTKAVGYPLSSREIIPSSYRKTYDKIAANLGVDHLVMGRIVKVNGGIKIELKVYSRGSRKFSYETDDLIQSYNETNDSGRMLGGRVYLYFTGSIPHMYNLDATRGQYYDRVNLTWNCSQNCSSYQVYRSEYQYGPYRQLVETSKNAYIDRETEPGIRYWYKVYAIKDGIPADFAERYGYRAIKPPGGEDMDDIMDAKDNDIPPPSSATEAIKRKKHLKILEDYYMNSIKLRFIIFVGKHYVRNGKVLIFNDLYPYYLDRDKLTLYVIDRDKYYIKLYCQKLIKILREAEAAGITRADLFDRLIKNGMLFCIRTGTVRIKTDDGRTRYLPSYEALGMATEYFKDYKGWPSHTIMMSTSNEQLSKEMEKRAN
jgi:hypothetical protein